MTDRDTGAPKFGFVKFNSQEELDEALSKSYQVNGQSIFTKPNKPRELTTILFTHKSNIIKGTLTVTTVEVGVSVGTRLVVVLVTVAVSVARQVALGVVVVKVGEVLVVETQADSTAVTVAVSEVTTVVALAVMIVETEDQNMRCTFQDGHKKHLKMKSKVVLKAFVVVSNKSDFQQSATIDLSYVVLDL